MGATVASCATLVTPQPTEPPREGGDRGALTVPAPPTATGPARETERAPASDARVAVRTDVPSACPTSPPDVDLDAFAAATSFRRDSAADLPLDLAVLVRVRGADLDGIQLRAAFLLGNVDGDSTIADIAARAQLPVSEAVGVFLELLTRGAVAIASSVQDAPDRMPPSGLYRKIDLG
jgi:hypothetical protein